MGATRALVPIRRSNMTIPLASRDRVEHGLSFGDYLFFETGYDDATFVFHDTQRTISGVAFGGRTASGTGRPTAGAWRS